jgi:Mlc titration factor MtfA (ptsG expression regulator)
MFGLLRRWRRRRLARRPFPETWKAILAEHVPFYRKLAPVQRPRFLSMLKVFAWEKHFIGAQGMQITDEVRVVISASAVRLVLWLDLSHYDRLTEIVVYPYVYRHKNETGAVLGEAHHWGTVVLSWPAVIAGLRDPCDGHDTAAHEFAHVLDRADGGFDGTPELRSRDDYAPWAKVMSERFLRLQRRAKPERQVLRMYGATNEAEFFAVATESFFERPRRMKEQTPDLYAEMQAFYGGDPAAIDDCPDDPPEPQPAPGRIYRNQPCPCRSGRKHKRCCGRRP